MLLFFEPSSYAVQINKTAEGDSVAELLTAQHLAGVLLALHLHFFHPVVEHPISAPCCSPGGGCLGAKQHISVTNGTEKPELVI